MGRVIGFVFSLSLFFITTARAQDLSEDEVQVNLNSYFDNFSVRIVYPSASLTKRFSDSSTVNVRYLVDVISAASMKSYFEVDGVTSATTKEEGGGDDKPDEVRHEFGIGFNDLMSGGLIEGGSVSLNTMYSLEHDYSSFTIAGTFSYLMARKNTTLQFGMVRSWDRSFPQIRDWKRKKDVYTPSVSLSQVLSKRLIAQLLFSYNKTTGYLSDPYQVVQIIQGNEVVNYETVQPDGRIRRAVGLRLNYKAGKESALNVGFRYYWDSWEINSFTTSLQFQQHLGPVVTFGLGLRNYLQSRAFFFKPSYLQPETYMTVDTKLDEGYSNDYELKVGLNGGHLRGVPLLSDPGLQLNFRMSFYHRHTETPDWHSRYKNLFAYVLSFGVRYRF